MRVHPSLAATPLLLVSQAVVLLFVPQAAMGADCLGFFNVIERGYKIEGDRLEPTNETVAAGTELKFNGIGKYRDKFYLTRSRSDVIYDAQNVELTGGCDLPTREVPRVK